MDYHTKLYKSYYKDENYMPHIDFNILKSRTQKMEKKMETNIKNILHNIKKLKYNQYKKYQISGYHEYKKIKNILDDYSKNDDCELVNNFHKYELIYDKKLYKNIVVCINGSFDSNCCTECDGRPKYDEQKVPVMYIKIYGLPHSLYNN